MSDKPELTINPAFQSLLPPLSADERQTLRESLVADGCRDPIVTWNGVILDGHNRYALCQELGLPFDVTWVELPDEEAAMDWIDRNQLARRNLTPDDFKLAVGRRYNRKKKAIPNPDGANQYREVSGQNVHQPNTAETIARESGVTERTVRRAGKFAEEVERIEEEEPQVNRKEAVRQAKETLRAYREEKREVMKKSEHHARQINFTATVADSSGEKWRMLSGDFRERLKNIPEGSVDLILTDPPYPEEFMPLWEDLAKIAAVVLRPQGIMVALTGSIMLPRVMAACSSHLSYGWIYLQPLPGSNSRILGRHILQTYKPWLAYSNGAWPSGRIDWHPDTLIPSARSKDRYRWEQDPDPAAMLIDSLCPAGGLVLDPMTGTGAYGLAALKMERLFLGIEKDDERFQQATERLKGFGDE